VRTTVVLSVLFLIAMFAMMEAEVLIAWFGPWLTIAPAMLLFRRWMNSPWGFGLSVYGFSIVLGIVAMEGFGMSNGDSARLAGWVLPPALMLSWLAFTFLVRLPGVGEHPRLQALAEGLGSAGRRIGGATLGALLGALGGALMYYVWDIGLLADVVLADHADTVLITASTVGGMLYGAWAVGGSSNNATPDAG